VAKSESSLHAHRQKRVRQPKKRVLFGCPADAVARLKKFGAKEHDRVLYIENRVGLKVLGAVDYLKRCKGAPIVVFGKPR
jgi:hypothetical protein